MTPREPVGPGPDQLVLLDDVGPVRRGRAYPALDRSALLLLPAGLLLGGLVLWPVLRTVAASVTDIGDGGFVGLANYQTALAADGAWAVVGRTLLWALVVPVAVTTLGYALAAFSARSRTGRVAQVVLVAPVAVPLVVTAVVFRFLYDPDPRRGLATWLSGTVFGEAPLFLGPGLITFTLMSAFVWAWVGLAVVVFRTALDAVPPVLADTVRAYGGNRLDVFRDAQWRPLLRRTAAVVFALVALGTARSFDLILVMAPGSVVSDASVLALRVWQTSGGSTNGPAAALGVIWLIAVAAGVVIAAWGIRQPWPSPPLRNAQADQRRSTPRPPQPEPGQSTQRSTEQRSTEQRPTEQPPSQRRSTEQRPSQRRPRDGSQPPGPVRYGRSWRVTRRIVLGVVMVIWIVPLLVLVLASLRNPLTTTERGFWAAPVGIGTYADLDASLWRSLTFTLLLAATVTVVVVLVATLAAYPMARLTGPGLYLLGVVLLAAAVVPVQVIAGPVNEVLGRLHLAGSAPGLALVHIALGLPFAVLVLRNALADVTAGQLRAAWRGRAGRAGVLWRLPQTIGPAVVAVAVLELVQVWNDLAVGLLFSGPDGVPVGLLLYGQARQFVANGDALAASSVVVSVLPLLLVVLTRNTLIDGLVSGVRRDSRT